MWKVLEATQNCIKEEAIILCINDTDRSSKMITVKGA